MFFSSGCSDGDVLRPDEVLEAGTLSRQIYQDIKMSQLVKAAVKVYRLSTLDRPRSVDWSQVPFCTLYLYFNSDEQALICIERLISPSEPEFDEDPDVDDLDDIFGLHSHYPRISVDDDASTLPDTGLVILGSAPESDSPSAARPLIDDPPAAPTPASSRPPRSPAPAPSDDTSDSDAELDPSALSDLPKLRREIYHLYGLDLRFAVDFSLAHSAKFRVLTLNFASKRGRLVIQFSNRHDLSNFENFISLVVPNATAKASAHAHASPNSSGDDSDDSGSDGSSSIRRRRRGDRGSSGGGHAAASPPVSSAASLRCRGGSGSSSVSAMSREFSGRAFGSENAMHWSSKKIFEWLKLVYFQTAPKSPVMSLYEKICTIGQSQILWSWLKSEGKGLHHLKEEFKRYAADPRSEFSRGHRLQMLFQDKKVMRTLLYALEDLKRSKYFFDETKQAVLDKLISYKQVSGKPIMLDALHRNMLTKMRYLYDKHECKRKIFFALLFEMDIPEWIEDLERQLKSYVDEKIEEAETQEKKAPTFEESLNGFCEERGLVFLDASSLTELVGPSRSDEEEEGEEGRRDRGSIVVPESLVTSTLRRTQTSSLEGVVVLRSAGSASRVGPRKLTFASVSLHSQLLVEKEQLDAELLAKSKRVEELEKQSRTLTSTANRVRARKARFELVVKRRADLEGDQKSRLQKRAADLATELDTVEGDLRRVLEETETIELAMENLEAKSERVDMMLHPRQDRDSWMLHRARNIQLMSSQEYFDFLDRVIQKKLKQAAPSFRLTVQLILSRLKEVPRDVDRVLAKLIVEPFLKPAFYQFGFVHASFALKNLGFHWFSNSLVMAKDFKQYDEYYEEILVVDAEVPVLPTPREIDAKIERLASQLVKWNRTYRYVSFKVVPDGLRGLVPSWKLAKNCQEFTMDMLNTLEYARMHTPIVEFIGSLKTRLHAGGDVEENIRDIRRLSFDEAFVARFEDAFRAAKGDQESREVVFLSHSQLDEFAHALLVEEPDFPMMFSEIWALLKSWDGGFWLRYDKACAKKGEPDVAELDTCEEARFGCPMKSREVLKIQ